MIFLAVIIMFILYVLGVSHLVNRPDYYHPIGPIILKPSLLFLFYFASVIAVADILGYDIRSWDDVWDFWTYEYFSYGLSGLVRDSKFQILAFAISLGIVAFFEIVFTIFTYQKAVTVTSTSTPPRSSLAVRICLLIGTIAGLVTIYTQLVIPLLKATPP